MQMEVKTENEMKTIKHEVVVDEGKSDEGKSDEAKPTAEDPLQKFVDDINEERNQKTLYKIQLDLVEAANDLRDIVEMIDLLKNLAKIMDAVDNNSIDDQDEGFIAVRKYISNITYGVMKVMQTCKDMKHKLIDCKSMVLKYEKKLECLEKENNYIVMRNSQEIENMHNTYEKHFNNLEITHQKQVEALEKEISEKDKQLKQLQEEADKAEKIKKLKRMNEERVMSKKELEDLEDSLSKEIKTLHMRKLFVQGLYDNVKPAIPDDEKQREVIEKSLTTSMKNMKSLKEEIDRIQKIVQQNTTRH